MYILFILCFIHAVKHGVKNISYLFGGLLFGLILEYVNVISNMGYTYGKFMVMFGRSPRDVPLCIGIGWSIIMYTAKLFTDQYRLPLWPAAALDTLLAISIDLGMDVVAYRLHMWHWNWAGTGLNPLTADWFGIPFGNFFGWQMVVFFYSSITRLLDKAFPGQKSARKVKFALVPLLSVILSQVFLYVMLVYVDKFLHDLLGITAMHRFIAFMLILIALLGWGIKKRKNAGGSLPFISWLVPVWFHTFFFAWLFLGGFYKENTWIVVAATVNLIIGLSIHLATIKRNAPSRYLSTPKPVPTNHEQYKQA